MAKKKSTEKIVKEKTEVVVAFKGFDAELKCRGFQYQVGSTYEHKGSVSACESGFHACVNPLDVLSYYPLLSEDAKPNRFAVVEQSGKLDRDADDSKIASASITITAELTIPEFVRRAVTWATEHCAKDAKEGETAASGHCSKLAASGDCSQLAASGENSVITSSSYSGTAMGAAGTWISLAEYDRDGKCVGFATGCIGNDGLKPDTWYRASGGKLVVA
jgi:hypothetical protein